MFLFVQVEFLLYTRQNPSTAKYVTQESASIQSSNFNGAVNTKFIIHGYFDKANKPFVWEMRDAFLTREDVNVIAVNWEKGANSVDYRQSVSNARVVGALIGEFMKALQSSTGSPYSSMHLIGHSLGAHVAGYAGEWVPGTGRITGLDPAGPSFEDEDVKVRLDPSDANFVDAIHTDAENLIKLGFGTNEPMGHADFYPNGGADQPGCTDSILKHFLALFEGFDEAKASVGCNHVRAIYLFTESISSSCLFQSYPCSSEDDFDDGKCTSCGSGCATMGYNADPTVHGTFYLSTTSSAPYC